jgi:hypothetical protein
VSFGKAWGFRARCRCAVPEGPLALQRGGPRCDQHLQRLELFLDQRTIDVFAQTGNDIPANSVELTLPRLNLGIAREFKFGVQVRPAGRHRLENTFDGRRNTLIQSGTLSADPRLGIELGYARIFYVRTGLSNIQYVTDISDDKQLSLQPNIGLGLRIKSFSLDYALTDIGDNSVALYSNIFSIKFDIFKRTAS